MIEQNWAKFEADHEKLTSSKSDISIEHDYFKQHVYENMMQFFVAAQAALKTRIAELEAANQPTGASFADVSLPTESHARPSLPGISIPRLSGHLSDWRPFSEMFVSVVENQPAISAVEKMHYLHSSLEGEALDLIADLNISSDSLATAWEIITKRCDNKRLLISSHIDKLVSLTKMKQREDWEMKLGASSEFPSLGDLTSFLTGTVRALENISKNTPSHTPVSASTSERSKSSSQRVHATRVGEQTSLPSLAQSPATIHLAQAEQVTTTRASQREDSFMELIPNLNKRCCFCQKDHFIVFCPEFRDISPANRLKISQSFRLCFNCLGRHNVANCRLTRGCKSSQQSQKRSSQTQKLKTSEFQKQTSQSTSKPASCLHDKRYSHTPVLLATSLVQVISDDNTSHQARVLIDPGSELTLVTTHLVKRVNAAVQQVNIPLIGVGNTSLGKTLGCAHLTLRSTHSSSQTDVKAHILNQITTEIPPLELTQQNWTHLNELELADPNFRKPGPVDIFIRPDNLSKIITPSRVRFSNSTEPIAFHTIFGWSVIEPASSNDSIQSSRSLHLVNNHDLQDLLTMFWVQEEVPTISNISHTTAEAACEEHFQATHTRDQPGHYQVRIPLSDDISKLGNSKVIA
ncbi:uncharacterized protein [Neodiprion pinetum]|uniref:uncharacterized protein n=1 Tax=Neodiprion pinetum TaxID=441929 RepID=UPI001EE1195D|nr:uncharacterized protein LOC124223344 [Neodiprion pinetum]